MEFTSDVTDMTSMFGSATATNPDVSNWDVSSVTNMTEIHSKMIVAGISLMMEMLLLNLKKRRINIYI